LIVNGFLCKNATKMLQKCYKNATGGIFWVSGEFGKDSFSCDGWWGKSGVDLVLILKCLLSFYGCCCLENKFITWEVI